MIISLFNLISPKSGKIFPTIKLNKVDFPAPFGPSNPKIWPWFKESEIFLRTGLPPNVFDILDIVRQIAIIMGDVIPTSYEQLAADINQDETIDILDVVLAVGIIIN